MANKRIIKEESEASQQAHALGLEYGGYGGWVIPKTRQVVAKTVNGKLVRTGEEQQEEKTDLGSLVLFHMQDNQMGTDPSKPSRFTKKYNEIIKNVLRKGGADIAVLVTRGTENRVADFLRKNDIGSGVKLVPLDTTDPNKVKDFVEQKIKEGYTSIHYYDSEQRNNHAVESLKAPYNKLHIKIKAHELTNADQTGHPEVKQDV